MRRGSAAKKHAARVAWLSVRPESMIGVPTIFEDVTDGNRGALDALEVEMVAAGLLGSVNREGRRETIRRLVGELRGGSPVRDWR